MVPRYMFTLAVSALYLLTGATTSFMVLGAFTAHVGFVSVALAGEALPYLALWHIAFGVVVSVWASESIVDEAVCFLRCFHEYID
jgi:hypothetical protein